MPSASPLVSVNWHDLGQGLFDTGFAIFAASVWSLSPGFAIDGKLPRVGLAVMDEEWELHATATI